MRFGWYHYQSDSVSIEQDTGDDSEMSAKNLEKKTTKFKTYTFGG
jgi:hypothetical protein